MAHLKPDPEEYTRLTEEQIQEKARKARERIFAAGLQEIDESSLPQVVVVKSPLPHVEQAAKPRPKTKKKSRPRQEPDWLEPELPTAKQEEIVRRAWKLMADEGGFTVEELVTSTKEMRPTRELTEYRYIAYYLIDFFTNLTPAQIGRLVGRKQQTVKDAINLVGYRMKSHDDFQERVESLIKALAKRLTAPP